MHSFKCCWASINETIKDPVKRLVNKKEKHISKRDF